MEDELPPAVGDIHYCTTREFCELKRDSETLAKVREIVQTWWGGKDSAEESEDAMLAAASVLGIYVGMGDDPEDPNA